jgi:hypothetical protein
MSAEEPNMSAEEPNAGNVDVTTKAIRNLVRIFLGAAVVCGIAYSAYLGYEVYQRGVVETLLR